jgi:hypothetical protein
VKEIYFTPGEETLTGGYMEKIRRIDAGLKALFMGIDAHEQTYSVSLFFEGEELLNSTYLVFLLRPYSRNIRRSLLKSPKLYLYNWAMIANPAARFENFVAAELWCRAAYWFTQTGKDYRLFYIRDKDRRETDFLMTLEGKPWILFEAKLSAGAPDKHHLTHQRELGNIPIVQVCRQTGIAERRTNNAYQVSAGRIFA